MGVLDWHVTPPVIVLCMCPLGALALFCNGQCEATEHAATAIPGALRLHEVARCGACVICLSH